MYAQQQTDANDHKDHPHDRARLCSNATHPRLPPLNHRSRARTKRNDHSRDSTGEEHHDQPRAQDAFALTGQRNSPAKGRPDTRAPDRAQQHPTKELTAQAPPVSA